MVYTALDVNGDVVGGVTIIDHGKDNMSYSAKPGTLIIRRNAGGSVDTDASAINEVHIAGQHRGKQGDEARGKRKWGENCENQAMVATNVAAIFNMDNQSNQQEIRCSCSWPFQP